MIVRAVCSAVGSHKVVKAGDGRASTPNYCWTLGCFSKSQLASIPPYCTDSAPSIILKAQITALGTRREQRGEERRGGERRRENLNKAYSLKIFLKMTLSTVSALFVYNHGGGFLSSTHNSSLYR